MRINNLGTTYFSIAHDWNQNKPISVLSSHVSRKRRLPPVQSGKTCIPNRKIPVIIAQKLLCRRSSVSLLIFSRIFQTSTFRFSWFTLGTFDFYEEVQRRKTNQTGLCQAFKVADCGTNMPSKIIPWKNPRHTENKVPRNQSRYQRYYSKLRILTWYLWYLIFRSKKIYLGLVPPPLFS